MSLAKKSKERKTTPRTDLIDQALRANKEYAARYDARLGKGPPHPKIVVVTCMDPRLTDLSGMLGMKTQDIDTIRTGGPNVTEDVLAELIVSTRVLGSKAIMVINHTGCGFTTFTNESLNQKLIDETGDSSPAPMNFFAFHDPIQQTLKQVRMIRYHPWIDLRVPVRGFVFDVDTGLLNEVLEPKRNTRQKLRPETKSASTRTPGKVGVSQAKKIFPNKEYPDEVSGYFASRTIADKFAQEGPGYPVDLNESIWDKWR